MQLIGSISTALSAGATCLYAKVEQVPIPADGQTWTLMGLLSTLVLGIGGIMAKALIGQVKQINDLQVAIIRLTEILNKTDENEEKRGTLITGKLDQIAADIRNSCKENK